MVIKLRYSEAYTVCKDSKVVLLRVGDGSITGRHGQAELTVTRR